MRDQYYRTIYRGI